MGIVSPAHVVYDYSTEIFLMLYSINWPNFIAWLPFLLKILGNMYILITCFPCCDVINFEMSIFPHEQKSKSKNLKELLRWNKKYFPSFLNKINLSIQNKLFWKVKVRSSCPEVFCKKVFLEISQNSQENICARVPFLIKLQATLLKKRPWHRCFPVNFVKFLKSPFLTEHLRWLLLGSPTLRAAFASV